MAIRDIGSDASGIELASQLARARMVMGDDSAGLEWAERALAGAQRLGLDAIATDLLVTRGTARFRLGDEEAGLADLRAAISQSEEAGSLNTELRARNNLAWLVVADDPARNDGDGTPGIRAGNRHGRPRHGRAAGRRGVRRGPRHRRLGLGARDGGRPRAARDIGGVPTRPHVDLRGDPRAARQPRADGNHRWPGRGPVEHRSAGPGSGHAVACLDRVRVGRAGRRADDGHVGRRAVIRSGASPPVAVRGPRQPVARGSGRSPRSARSDERGRRDRARHRCRTGDHRSGAGRA